MEDLIGIVVFLVLAGLSLVGRMARKADQGSARPAMPPPVPPTQQQPPKPLRQQPTRAERRAASQSYAPRNVDDEDEGVSSELRPLRTALHTQSAPPMMPVNRTEESPIGRALEDRASVAQAIVLAEVLGKPLALRGRNRR